MSQVLCIIRLLEGVCSVCKPVLSGFKDGSSGAGVLVFGMFAVGEEGGRLISFLHLIKFVNRGWRFEPEIAMVARMFLKRDP